MVYWFPSPAFCIEVFRSYLVFNNEAKNCTSSNVKLLVLNLNPLSLIKHPSSRRGAELMAA